MPRQLPWANKGNKSKPTRPPKPAQPQVISHSDDDFDAGLERNDVPEREGWLRAPSSSPPPVAEPSPPEIEVMDRGVNRFDLRDDEWIMVEDEFLQTAKLFTRHLHLAEYERMKTTIGQKRGNISRPTVQDARPSIEGEFKLRAEEQQKSHEKAIKNVDMSLVKPTYGSFKKPISTKRNAKNIGGSLSVPAENNMDTSDSDDLDIPRKRPFNKRIVPNSKSDPDTVKPSLPGPSFMDTRASNTTKFNLEKPNQTDATKQAAVRPEIKEPVLTQTTRTSECRTGASISKRTGSKEVSERLAKRKAEREKEAKKKAKADEVEIPTFMF
ncbi:unnamed protein product [Periconia digitata]|uniref:Uncharacterized protein n=1 Tax=Periconia digitata TaxID=1303443 RepID=A0A9W4XDJ9_9PLEO|nr:unnamed protein product [Periconia digitata]